MKKNKKILVGATLLASAAVLSGCKDNRFQALYGPPPELNIEEPAVAPPSIDPQEDVLPETEIRIAEPNEE